MGILHFLDHNTPTIARMILAVLIGGCIGIEREFSGRPAGFRTHILVCLGSCLIAMIDTVIPGTGGRVAAQVVTGVGFLGAGTILRTDKGSSVHGLTTAASLWSTAGMGIALGFGPPMMWYACVAAVLVLLTLTVAGAFEDFVVRHHRIHRLTLTLRPSASPGTSALAEFVACLASLNTRLKSLEVDETDVPGVRIVHGRVQIDRAHTRESLTEELYKLNDISDISWDA